MDDPELWDLNVFFKPFLFLYLLGRRYLAVGRCCSSSIARTHCNRTNQEKSVETLRSKSNRIGKPGGIPKEVTRKEEEKRHRESSLSEGKTWDWNRKVKPGLGT